MSSIPDSVVDSLVLRYLSKRNFKEAEKILSLEIRASGAEEAPPSSVFVGAEDGTLQEALVAVAAGGGDPAALAAAYDQFASWVDGSLQTYRPELSQFLYPLAVHSYLTLVGVGASRLASDLLSRHGRRWAGSPARAAELREVQSASSPEQLSSHRAAVAWRAGKRTVSCSSWTRDVLFQFLSRPSQLPLLALCNERLLVRARDGAPLGSEAVAAEERSRDAAGGAGRAAAAAGLEAEGWAALHARPVRLELLKGSVEEGWALAAAERAEKEAQEASDALAPAATKRERVQRAKALADAKQRREELGGAFLQPDIPLPPLSDERRAAKLAALEARDAVSPGGLPSILCATAVNTAQTLACMAFGGGADALAAGFTDASIRVMSLSALAGSAAAEPALVASRTLLGHRGAVCALSLSEDDSLLLSGGVDGTARMWSLELGEGLAAYCGHDLPVWAVAFAPGPPHYWLSGGGDGVARLWVTERAAPVRLMAGHGADVDALAWHPNLHLCATGSADRSARLWDVRDGAVARVCAGGGGAGVSALAISPDGRLLAAGDRAGNLALWDLAAARVLQRFQGHAGAVWSLDFCKGSGGVLASGGADCALRLWDARGGGEGPAQAQVAAPAPANKDPPLASYRTKATPVVALAFTDANLLRCGGPLSLYKPAKLRAGG